jgi:hypothetical protein
MASKGPTGDTVTLRLQEAIDRLQDDVKRVEIWAGALSGFLQPVPDYDGEQASHMLTPQERRGPPSEKTGGGGHASRTFRAPFKQA